MRPEGHKPSAPIVWFDPGLTTGVAVIALDPAWLTGEGSADFAGFRRATVSLWAEQYGREPGTWDIERKRASHVEISTVDREGLWGNAARVGGGELSHTDREEIEIVRQCQDFLDLWPNAVWGYESWQPRPGVKTGEQFSALRIGKTLAYSEIVHGERGRAPFTQSMSMAVGTVNDDRAKLAGVYFPGLPHATDAMRHVLTFARRCRGDAQHAKQAKILREQAWPGLFAAGGRLAS